MCKRYFEEDNCRYYPNDCYHCEHSYSYDPFENDELSWPEDQWLGNWETARLVRWCNLGLFSGNFLKDALVELFYRGVTPELIDNEVWKYVSDIHEDAV